MFINRNNFNGYAWLKPNKPNNNPAFEGGIKGSSSFGEVDNNVEILDKIHNLLNNKIYVFKNYKNKEFKGTIKKYLEGSIISKKEVNRCAFPIYHCTTVKYNVDKILENGLDWRKNITNRMNCGPGTYFCYSVGECEFYGIGHNAIQASYKGDKKFYPIFEPCFYQAIANNQDILNDIKNIKNIAKNTAKNIDADRILADYCHDVLANEIDIDFLYASTGRAGGAIVVLNNDCMSLSRYQ